MDMTGEVKIDGAKLDKSSVQATKSSKKVVAGKKVGTVFEAVTEDLCENMSIEKQAHQPDGNQCSQADHKNNITTETLSLEEFPPRGATLPNDRTNCFGNGDQLYSYQTETETLNESTVLDNENNNVKCEPVESCNSQNSDTAVEGGLEIIPVIQNVTSMKRKRGRPRKQETSPSNVKVEGPVIKRGRGRPPKSSYTTESILANDERPSQTEPKPDELPSIRKGRGKPPRWTAEHYVLDISGLRSSTDGCSEASENELFLDIPAANHSGNVGSATNTPTGRRGPGRPRKSTTSTSQCVKSEIGLSNGSSPNGAIIRRGPGRPRKYIPLDGNDRQPSNPRPRFSDASPGGVIKRRRGRPPKNSSISDVCHIKREDNVINQNKPENMGELKQASSRSRSSRGPGRPPKTENGTPECPVVKRGRGRPPKSKDKPANARKGVKRGPGRPRKILGPADLIKEVDAMFRRGRGRPPKKSMFEIEDKRIMIKRELEAMIIQGPNRRVKSEPDSPADSEYNLPNPFISATPTQSIIPRRGPGRPPKNQSTSLLDNRLITFEVEAMIRRGRGRPRKYFPMTDNSVVPNRDTDPNCMSGLRVDSLKRGRGRPPVYHNPGDDVMNRIALGKSTVVTQEDLRFCHLGVKSNISTHLIKKEPFIAVDEKDMPNDSGDLPNSCFREASDTKDEMIPNKPVGDVIVKRGRGRPRKNDNQLSRARPQKIRRDENDSKPVGKRPRGRPRIYPVGERPSQVSKKPGSTGKRGRPRKNPLPNDSVSSASEKRTPLKVTSPLKVALKSVEKGVKDLKRGRGRKRIHIGKIDLDEPEAKEAKLVSETDDKQKSGSDSKSEDSLVNENGSD